MARWQPIRDYNNYEISDDGRVRNIKTGRILKNGSHKQGYSLVWLSNNGNTNGKSVHRLVADAFIPNPESKPQINHIDGNKNNNHVSNLEWCTGSENTRHAYETSLFDGRPKKAVRIIETGEEFASIKDCAAALSGSPGNICSCLKGRIESYRGLHFEYVR